MQNSGADQDFEQLSQDVGRVLLAHGLTLATAESCTGGWVAQVVTQTSGSSRWFDRGFVTYTNEAKQEMLGVEAQTLNQYGAVSEQTVQEMAEGAIENSRAQIALAISGVAGPTGGTAEKPVGMVCFAWARANFQTQTVTRYFEGDRHAVRRQAVQFTLRHLIDMVAVSQS
ncbi:MAG: nicotinamide-nucleotide amidase [Gammaproteobacteria bacterium]|jgi:nicotinamide-nucleotide amidase